MWWLAWIGGYVVVAAVVAGWLSYRDYTLGDRYNVNLETNAFCGIIWPLFFSILCVVAAIMAGSKLGKRRTDAKDAN